MRADAVRNRDRILGATVDLVLEQGPAVGMEAIARRAGVGVATVYRHFPDRASLLAHVQLGCLRATADEAEAALAEEHDAFSALARYMHKVVELRVSAVMPLLNDRVHADDELILARRRGRAAIDSLVDRAACRGDDRRHRDADHPRVPAGPRRRGDGEPGPEPPPPGDPAERLPQRHG
jgi:AcrR family transcriptional regulator